MLLSDSDINLSELFTFDRKFVWSQTPTANNNLQTWNLVNIKNVIQHLEKFPKSVLIYLRVAQEFASSFRSDKNRFICHIYIIKTKYHPSQSQSCHTRSKVCSGWNIRGGKKETESFVRMSRLVLSHRYIINRPSQIRGMEAKHPAGRWQHRGKNKIPNKLLLQNEILNTVKIPK